MTDKWTPGPIEVMAADGGYCSVIAPSDKAAKPWWTAIIHCADDEVGSRVAAFLGASHDMAEALSKIVDALCNDTRDKSILGDDVEYHIDGQTMGYAINLARAALAKARGRT